MASLLVHWDGLLARLTASVVPVTRRILAGVGVTLSPLDGQLDEDVTVAVKPHADGSILADSGGVRVGIISDAQHGSRGGGSVHAVAVASGAAGFLSGADKAKLDGVTAGAPGLTSAAPTAIQPDDAAAVGTATTAARADHVHAIVAAAAGAIAIGDSAAEGSSASFARADHCHSLAAPATPATIGTANATGSATSPAHADHVHSHGAQSDGSLHAAAIASGASGFLSGTDKALVDSWYAAFGSSSATTFGAYGVTPVTHPSAYTQTYSTATRTFAAYTADDESAAYVGVNNVQVGSVYATVADLNALRVAVENLRAFAENAAQMLNASIDDDQVQGLKQ